MIKCYFINLQNITMSELENASCSVKAAVVWINFAS